MRKRRGISEKIGLLCLALVVGLGGMGVGLAHWQENLTIGGTVGTGTWPVGGSAGFWNEWDSHNTYTEDEILDFLAAIDGASDWLAGTIDDISAMEAVFAAGKGGTMEQKFLRHYLATRLNVEASRLSLGTSHLFSILDPPTIDYPDGYLGLEGENTLEWIIKAIEGKYDEVSPPTDEQFEIMKDICDALNDLDI